jgi:hypothetical protein
MKEDPEVSASGFKDVHMTFSRSLDSDTSTSDEDERLRPASVRKRLRNKRWTRRQSDKRLKGTQGSFNSSRSDDARVELKAKAQPEVEQTAIQSVASSKFDANCPPKLAQKVKLRRNRLLNVETIPKHLKAV